MLPYLCMVLGNKVLHPLDEIGDIARMAIALGDTRGQTPWANDYRLRRSAVKRDFTLLLCASFFRPSRCALFSPLQSPRVSQGGYLSKSSGIVDLADEADTWGIGGGPRLSGNEHDILKIPISRAVLREYALSSLLEGSLARAAESMRNAGIIPRQLCDDLRIKSCPFRRDGISGLYAAANADLLPALLV